MKQEFDIQLFIFKKTMKLNLFSIVNVKTLMHVSVLKSF